MRAGRRDARSGIVALPDEPGATRILVTTGRIGELTSLTEHLIASELLRHHRLRARLQARRSTRVGPLEAQIERTNQAAQWLAEAEKEELSRYERVGDERHPRSYVRSRQFAEAERRRAAAGKSYVEEKGRLGEVQERIAAIDLAIQALDEVTMMRVQRAHAHGNRRVFAYWASLVRHHPAAADLNDRCAPAGPSLPCWASLHREGTACEG